jgi:hypothetical protein
MIKLKQGDYINVSDVSVEDKHEIIKCFIECGASGVFYKNNETDWDDDYFVGWDHHGDCNGFSQEFPLYEMGLTDEVDAYELLAQIRLKESKSNDITLEEMRKSTCNRNVVFVDYNTSKHEGTLQITITEGQEFNACFKGIGCVDSVEMNLDKEDFIELLKSWRKVINGAIVELED